MNDARSSGSSCGQVEFELGVKGQGVGGQIAQAKRGFPGPGLVQHDHLRLVGEQAERAERLLVVGREAQRGDELAVFERRLDSLDDGPVLFLAAPSRAGAS